MELSTYSQQINHPIHNNHWNVNTFMSSSTPIPQTYMFAPSPTLVDPSLPSMYFPSSDLEPQLSPPQNTLSPHTLFGFNHSQPQFPQYPENNNLMNTSFPPKDFQACLPTPPLSSFGTAYSGQQTPPESDHISSSPQSKRDRITLNEKRKRIILKNLFDNLNDSLPPLKTSRYTRYRSLIHASLYIKRLQSNISQLNQLANHLETHHNMYQLPLPINNAKTIPNILTPEHHHHHHHHHHSHHHQQQQEQEQQPSFQFSY